MILTALALLFAVPTPVDNVHLIYCKEGFMNYQGTGWFIGDGVMATAYHVANSGTCVDSTTGESIKTYKSDKDHDFALMAGSHSTSVVKYSCDHPKPHNWYISYGYSSHYADGHGDFWNPDFQIKLIKATKKRPIFVPGLWNIYPYRQYDGAIMHGMSGGPVSDKTGTAYALNNAGDDTDSLLYDLADTALCTGKWD